MHSSCGGMAELVDALDSKSCGLRPCQFESDYPYQVKNPEQIVQDFFVCLRTLSLICCDKIQNAWDGMNAKC